MHPESRFSQDDNQHQRSQMLVFVRVSEPQLNHFLISKTILITVLKIAFSTEKQLSPESTCCTITSTRVLLPRTHGINWALHHVPPLQTLIKGFGDRWISEVHWLGSPAKLNGLHV